MISKKEFYEFIAQFNKNPGEYTPEELYQIGCKHKELALKDKCWKDLAKHVGYPGNPNSYRCFVNRRQAADGLLEVKDKNKILNDSEEYQLLYKEKTQIRDTYNRYRASLRDEARLESFKDSLLKAIKNLPPLNIESRNVKVKKATELDVEGILMVSDMHLGVNCNNFYNTYNYDVAKERIAKLVADTKDYCIKFNIKKLNVINLGDMIHGIIHTTARIEEEFDVVNQVIKASELLSWLLIEFSNLGIQVTYRSCTDNHSRIMADKKVNIEAENLNQIIDWYLKARLENTSVEFSNDNIDESLGKFDLLNGKKVMFAHGHLENVNKCIDAFHGATKQFIDYVLLSHYHSSREKAYNGSKLIINGSIVGTEQYALSKRLFGPAEQKLLVFDKDNFLNININLQ